MVTLYRAAVRVSKGLPVPEPAGDGTASLKPFPWLTLPGPSPNIPPLAAPSPVAIVRQSSDGCTKSRTHVHPKRGCLQGSRTVRILLTGSSGRVGRNLLMDGLAARHQVTAFDWTPPPTRLDNVRYAAGSILDRKDLSDAMQGAEAVIHLAAIPYDIPPLHQVFRINVQGTYHALELAVEHGVRHFLHASSLMAYGFGRNAEAQYLPIDEDHPAASHDTYGVGKLLTESLCRAFTDKFGLRTLCFRLTHFTAFLRPYGDRFPYDDDSGIQGLHEYIESRDLVGLLEAALASEQVQHDVFLASGPDSGHVLPTPEVIRKYHPKAELRYGRLEPASPFISMEKSRRLLGFTPSTSWRDYGLTGEGLVNRPLSPE